MPPPGPFAAAVRPPVCALPAHLLQPGLPAKPLHLQARPFPGTHPARCGVPAEGPVSAAAAGPGAASPVQHCYSCFPPSASASSSPPPCCRCTLVNSPLATNVTGQMKDILTTALGMFIFSGERHPGCCCLLLPAAACCCCLLLPALTSGAESAAPQNSNWCFSLPLPALTHAQMSNTPHSTSAASCLA